MGMIDRQDHKSATDAAKDYVMRAEKASATYEANKTRSIGEKIGIVAPEVHAVENGRLRTLTAQEASSFRQALTHVRETPAFMNAVKQEAGDVLRRFGVVGKVAGAAVAGTLAIASGAQASEIGRESINGALPGLGTLVLGEGPKRGRLCQAFGEATGAVAGVGVGLAAGAATSLTGPGAVAVGVVAGGATEAVATPAATKLCNMVFAP